MRLNSKECSSRPICDDIIIDGKTSILKMLYNILYINIKWLRMRTFLIVSQDIGFPLPERMKKIPETKARMVRCGRMWPTLLMMKAMKTKSRDTIGKGVAVRTISARTVNTCVWELCMSVNVHDMFLCFWSMFTHWGYLQCFLWWFQSLALWNTPRPHIYLSLNLNQRERYLYR